MLSVSKLHSTLLGRAVEVLLGVADLASLVFALSLAFQCDLDHVRDPLRALSGEQLHLERALALRNDLLLRAGVASRASGRDLLRSTSPLA